MFNEGKIRTNNAIGAKTHEEKTAPKCWSSLIVALLGFTAALLILRAILIKLSKDKELTKCVCVVYEYKRS